MKKIIYQTCLLVLWCAPGLSWAGPTVDNFTLLDHNGEAHELYYYGNKKAIVLMVQGNGCGVVRNSLPELTSIRDRYQKQGISFFLINSNLQDTRESIHREAEEFGIDLPILVDDDQLVGESLGIVRTGEVYVINPANWQLVYRGPLNNRVGYGTQTRKASKNYVTDVLDKLINDENLAFQKVHSVGCLVNLPNSKEKKKHDEISYQDTIAPLLMNKCVSCHRPKGIAPWAMTSYQMIAGFAPMIREVVRTKRMPPWHADPYINKFSHDLSLSIQEKKTLVHWIEAGAPKDNGTDPLLQVTPKESEWDLGKPDLILNVPTMKVPASGVIDYQHLVAPNPLDRDVWVKAVQIIPGDPQVVHHGVFTLTTQSKIDLSKLSADQIDDHLITYVPGSDPEVYPENTGVLLKKGTNVYAQMHYTTSGKATTDNTRIGLYFSEKPPKHSLHYYTLVNMDIEIKPNSVFRDRAYYQFKEDVYIYNLFAHAHFRGKSAKFTVIRNDGREEDILSVPNYDFNWQRNFQLETPMFLPAGSTLVYYSTFDNTSQKPGNPDPNKTIYFGEQSWDEMLYGGVTYRFKGNEPPAKDPEQYIYDSFIGYMDSNIDHKISRDEFYASRVRPDNLAGTPKETEENSKDTSNSSRKDIFSIYDINQNNYLELEELMEMMQTSNSPEKTSP